MSKCYLLPCPSPECEHKIQVDTRQAGGNVCCPQCQTNVDVPRFRDLKQLEPSADSSQSKEFKPNPLKGAFFSIGLGIAVVAGLAGWGLFNYATHMVEETTFNSSTIADMVNAPVEDATPVELWDTWYNLLDGEKLPEWKEATWNRYNKQGQILKQFSYGLFGIGGAGVLLLLSSFFLPNRRG